MSCWMVCSHKKGSWAMSMYPCNLWRSTQGSGSVSLFALQLARTLGARVIATTSSEAKADRLRALGAEAVIDYIATPEWSSAVLALTDGRGVDRVIEVGGTGTILQSIKSVTYKGEIALVGMLAPSDTGMSLIDFFLSRIGAPQSDWTLTYVRAKFDWMYSRIQIAEARALAAPLHEAAMQKLRRKEEEMTLAQGEERD